MMGEDAVAGVTSNPTIFQKAIRRGRLRRPARELLATSRTPQEIFIALAAATSATPATSSAPSGTTARGRDGYVSLEVDPTLAYDTEATIERGARLHALVDRPNLYVKIPATKEGLPRSRR